MMHTCFYSTLNFVCSEAKRHQVTPILTFDQPLWWKAVTIVSTEPAGSDLHSMVLRLGGFHVLMSFLGCIGHVMKGSGFQDLLEIVYSQNTVVHMISGKAIARAVRGHFLVDSALHALIMKEAYKTSHENDQPTENENINVPSKEDHEERVETIYFRYY